MYDTLSYAIFMKSLKLEFIHKKNDTLRYVKFLYTKSWHFTKSKTICFTFYMQKSGHFALRDFSLNFWDWRREVGNVYIQKQCTLHYIFICIKQSTMRYVFIYKKPDTLRNIFICKKTMHFALHFYL